MQLSILLLASERVAAGTLSAALSRPGHGVTVVGLPEELIREAAGFSMVVIDQVPATTTVGAIITELRNAEATAKVPVLAVAQYDDLERRIALLEAGADDIITKPFDQVELEARVEAVALRFERSRTAAPTAPTTEGEPRARRVITVFSPKGGVGATTIATNLALIAAEEHPNNVLILDLDLSFGQVATHLNLEPKQTLVEVIHDETALRDAEVFRTYAVHHASGVHLLAAPATPGFASQFTPEHVELILARALEAYRIVVVDGGANFDERSLAMFSRSDVVLIPVLPEIPTLHAVHVLLDQLAETGAMGATTMFVLNNAFPRELLKRTDIESALGAKVTASLPYDPFVYLKAVNEGVPVVRSAPKTIPTESLRHLAGIVFGTGERTATPPAAERKGLFGRRR